SCSTGVARRRGDPPRRPRSSGTGSGSTPATPVTTPPRSCGASRSTPTPRRGRPAPSWPAAPRSRWRSPWRRCVGRPRWTSTGSWPRTGPSGPPSRATRTSPKGSGPCSSTRTAPRGGSRRPWPRCGPRTSWRRSAPDPRVDGAGPGVARCPTMLGRAVSGRGALMATDVREVLVVEDDPLIVSFMRTALRKSGHHVHSAGSGEAARELLRDGAIDLLLLDLTLPDMDGLDLLRDLRQSGSDVPVVVVTSRSDPADRATALELGVEDYVVKPFPLRDLLALVTRVLE